MTAPSGRRAHWSVPGTMPRSRGRVTLLRAIARRLEHAAAPLDVGAAAAASTAGSGLALPCSAEQTTWSNSPRHRGGEVSGETVMGVRANPTRADLRTARSGSPPGRRCRRGSLATPPPHQRRRRTNHSLERTDHAPHHSSKVTRPEDAQVMLRHGMGEMRERSRRQAHAAVQRIGHVGTPVSYHAVEVEQDHRRRVALVSRARPHVTQQTAPPAPAEAGSLARPRRPSTGLPRAAGSRTFWRTSAPVTGGSRSPAGSCRRGRRSSSTRTACRRRRR